MKQRSIGQVTFIFSVHNFKTQVIQDIFEGRDRDSILDSLLKYVNENKLNPTDYRLMCHGEIRRYDSYNVNENGITDSKVSETGIEFKIYPVPNYYDLSLIA